MSIIILAHNTLEYLFGSRGGVTDIATLVDACVDSDGT